MENDAAFSPEGNLKGRIEAILFVAGERVLLTDLAHALVVSEKELMQTIEQMQGEYDFEQRGFCIRIFGDSVQLTTRPLYAPDVVHLLQPVQKQSLSQSIMETLAVVAYKQPVTRGEIEQLRGVKCDYSVNALVQKGLICEVGRKEALGRPILYGTTDGFLQHFGISSLDDLPPLKTEEPEAPNEELIT